MHGSLSRYSVSSFRISSSSHTQLPSSSSSERFILLLPHLSHFCILLVTSRTSLSPANSSSPFSNSATNHCCREEELAVKRLRGALRRFPWRATPSSTDEGASSASTVEVSAIVLCFRHCCRSREALSSLRIKWSVSMLRIKLIRKLLKHSYGSLDP